jgi:serine/threonine-protein kinase
MVFDFIPGCTLFDVMEIRDYTPMNEDEIRSILSQLTDALIAMHERGIVHLDLKLENVMITESNIADSEVTIIDFGFCDTGSVLMIPV